MDTLHKDSSVQATLEENQERRQPRSEADFLRMAAERRERHGQPVTALLFRNEAWRMESQDADCSVSAGTSSGMM